MSVRLWPRPYLLLTGAWLLAMPSCSGGGSAIRRTMRSSGSSRIAPVPSRHRCLSRRSGSAHPASSGTFGSSKSFASGRLTSEDSSRRRRSSERDGRDSAGFSARPRAARELRQVRERAARNHLHGRTATRRRFFQQREEWPPSRGSPRCATRRSLIAGTLPPERGRVRHLPAAKPVIKMSHAEASKSATCASPGSCRARTSQGDSSDSRGGERGAD